MVPLRREPVVNQSRVIHEILQSRRSDQSQHFQCRDQSRKSITVNHAQRPKTVKPQADQSRGQITIIHAPVAHSTFLLCEE